MVGPWGALPVGLGASTTEVEDGIDGEPPGVRYRWVQQRSPLRLKKMLMAGPLGSAASRSSSVHHRG
jgi:hypothetical protein